MNIWHDISPKRIRKDRFYAVIEIQKGGKNKYELDKETGMLKLDRVLFTSTHYPANYGFIPRTYASDKDPLDVLVLCSEQIQPMTIVECAPIGVLMMEDGGADDAGGMPPDRHVRNERRRRARRKDHRRAGKRPQLQLLHQH